MARPFEGVFGNTCELRLIEFLLPLDGMEFNITELAEEAGVSRVTAGRVVKKFVEWGILTATSDPIPRYSIDPSSPIVQSIDVMNNSLIGRMLGDEKVREIRNTLKKRMPATDRQERGTSTEDSWEVSPIEPMRPGNQRWRSSDGRCTYDPNPMYPTPPCVTADEHDRGFLGYIQ